MHTENLYSLQHDAMGAAIIDFWQKKVQENKLEVFCSIAEVEIFPIDYLFRTYTQMPHIEQKALQMSYGHILDIGAAAGCHSLYLQQQNKSVTACDISSFCVQVMQEQGIQNILQADVWQLPNTQQYDTILLLMNGIGLAENLQKLPTFLNNLKNILSQNGQILFTSTDIRYMYEKVNKNKIPYYGEVSYQMRYGNVVSHFFDWLYLDIQTAKKIGSQLGWKTELVATDKTGHYLMRLS